MWTLSCRDRPVTASSGWREVMLDVVYLLVVAVLALSVGLVARGVEKL
ncbi:hypothetical protein [Leifsonia sp. fls2-241-R2A-40a]|nr:hypothetical protein [Leifsonia sp. fls2-241-R2A-40a]